MAHGTSRPIDTEQYEKNKIKDPDGVTKVDPKLQEIAEDLRLINHLCGGERTMIDNAEEYLPKDIFETNEGYEARKNRAVLVNFFNKIRRLIVGTILKKPFVIEDDDLSFEQICTEDGQTLKGFARNALDAAWKEGLSLIFVDYPRLSQEFSSLAEFEAIGARPYFVLINRSQLLSFKGSLQTVETSDGRFYKMDLDYLRYKTRDGDNQEIILVYEKTMAVNDLGEPVTAVIWRQYELIEESDNEKTWMQTDTGSLSIPVIPVSVIYMERTGYIESEIPLLEIAQLNRRHFQVESDLFQLLHLLANPKLALFGVDQEDMDLSKSKDLGLVFESPEARMEWVTLQSTNTVELQNKLDRLEQQITTQVIQVFEQKHVAETEDSKKIDRDQNASVLAMSADSLEQALNKALELTTLYTDQQTPPTVTVNKDFQWGALSTEDLKDSLQLWLAGGITQETLLKRLESKGYFDGIQEFDIETELERTQA